MAPRGTELKGVRVTAFLVILNLLLSVDLSFSHTPSDPDGIESIFEIGKYEVKDFTVSSKNTRWPSRKCLTDSGSAYPASYSTDPPRPLRIVVPTDSGEYPVVHLQHGFTLQTNHYTQLMEHVASHGFIVIAPQMRGLSWSELFKPDASNEIASAAAVIDWYPNNLAAAIAKGVSESSTTITPNLKKLSLVGHSRGGKVAFALARGLCKTSLKFVAIAGLDPVDGISAYTPLKPEVMPYRPCGLNLTFPTLIIGEKLSHKGILPFVPACSPAGVNYVQFFNNSAPRALKFVAKEYGHMDFLNDDFFDWICRGNATREPMRRFSGGMLVAFLQATLFGDSMAVDFYFKNPGRAPVKLDPPDELGWFGNRHADI